MEPFWSSQWQVLCDRCFGAEGYASLSRAEKVWINVRALIDSTNNGGAISFFYNSPADRLEDALEALTMLNLADARLQVERVCALFGRYVPATVELRNEVIASWPDYDEARERVLDDVDTYLYLHMDMIEQRLEDFIRAEGLASQPH
jgi:hypothetical protein